ncbi:RRP12-like protein isoform X3 [Gracilinanus agilis]|uniref:RRP12-like protein isoform X3 n=1 Tax=Gracilinanus agilis TaxID=191870 RepID=UPI001CFE6F5F|nr:RRP12-like protein isoform X3 [Gracilinanus agilis]
MGRSGKLPSGSSAKLKRWKKGHSSDSNPTGRRHRQAARSRFFSRPSEKSDLTVDALKLHNELQTGPLPLARGEKARSLMEDESDPVLSEKSSGTFLSGLSDCTNVTFSKVQRFWESNSAAHKEICAVLAAVTEVIRSQGGKETETEYFGALVRKAAQHGVCSVIKGSEFLFGDKAPTHHPAALSTAKFCIQEIEKSGGSKEATTTLHVLTLLTELLSSFPVGTVKSCCETLLRVMTLGHVLVTACAMQAFHGFFHSKPNPGTLSAELNAQIITALYDYLPSENDLQPLLAWLTVMEKAHTNLVRLQRDLGLGHLPRFFGAAMNCLLSPHAAVAAAATQSLKVILTECIAPHMTDIGPVSSSASGPPLYIAKMFRTVEEGLTYKFHSVWDLVLQLLRGFFEACGKQAHLIMRKCLQSLCDLRLSPHFPHTLALDQAVGAAVTSMGPEVVLQAVPLEIDGFEENLDFPRSWLLPVIRDHVQNTRLGFFTSYFLPLATTLKNRATELAQEGSTMESKIYDTLQWQIWTLLPGFCTKPTDVAASFKGIARTLGTAISERPDLRLTVCQALRTLITKGCETEADRAEVSRFAKNFLPILFNVYGQPLASGETTAPRRAVLDTIKTYLTITEPELVNGFLEKASEKVLDPSSSDFTRHSILDLIVALAPHADETSISKLYSTIRPYLESKEHTMQKKAYRVLEEVCASQEGPGERFVQSHLGDLKKTLLDSLRSTASPAKRPRLKCLINIIKKLTSEHEEFITALVPEVILCTKEVSVGARKNAFVLLLEMGRAFLRFDSNQEAALQRYLLLIYPGLAGSVTMISCSVLALTHLLFEFKGLMGTDAIEQLLRNVCLLLASRTRDVVKSALGFIKVVLLVMDVTHVAKHLQLMMEAIGNLADDMRRHFRMKLRNLFTKFIRKFGFELVKGLLPEDYHRVLVNIRKAEARSKKQRALQEAVSVDEDDEPPQARGDSIEEILADSDEDEESEKPGARGQRKLARQRSSAWLKEGGEDEPLNFLDPQVSQRVLATQPGANAKRKKDHDFKLSADGRLIIREEGEQEEEEAATKEVDEEMTDLKQEVRVLSRKARKLKLWQDQDDDEAEPPPQYRAGGSGIHRPLASKPGADYRAKKGRGDVKKKGRPDPYAYIPLNKAKLNHRKKAKMQGQFKGLVKAAQRGAQAGHKNRRKKPRV